MCSLFEVLMCSLFEVLMCSSFEVLMCGSFEVLTCSLFHSGRKNFLYFFINYQDAVFSVLRSPTSRLVWPNTTLLPAIWKGQRGLRVHSSLLRWPPIFKSLQGLY